MGTSRGTSLRSEETVLMRSRAQTALLGGASGSERMLATPSVTATLVFDCNGHPPHRGGSLKPLQGLVMRGDSDPQLVQNSPVSLSYKLGFINKHVMRCMACSDFPSQVLAFPSTPLMVRRLPYRTCHTPRTLRFPLALPLSRGGCQCSQTPCRLSRHRPRLL